MNNSKKAIRIYRRVSTEERQAKQGTSLESQEETLSQWASLKGAGQVVDYCDGGYTGRNGDRPALKRLLEEAGNGDVVVVVALDRMARNLRLLLDIIDRLTERGVSFISLKESIDTSIPFGRLILSIMGSIAEWERETIVERTREGRLRRYTNGQWGPGQPPYGYRYNKETRELELETAEALVVRRIFDLYVYQRLGCHVIAMTLNKEGVPPRQGARRWYKSAVMSIIQHPAYIGTHPTGARCPRIVSDAEWAAAQRLRQDNHRLHRREGSPWELQGITFCGESGHAMSCSYSHGKRRVYSCPGRLRLERPEHPDKCGLRPVDAEWLEGAVWSAVADALSDPEHLRDQLDGYISSMKRRVTDLERNVKPIDEERAAIAARRNRLAEKYVRDNLLPDRLAELEAEVAEDERRLEVRAEGVDPAKLQELTQARLYLMLWTKARSDLDLDLSFTWFIHQETAALDDEMRTTARKYSPAQVAERNNPAPNEVVGFPGTRRQLLDRLQVRVTIYQDRVEIAALLPIPPIKRNQESDPICR